MIKKHLPLLIGFFITISLLWPLFYAPYFTHHDDVQVIRLHQMNKCIQDLQIPCRWVPDVGGLYGYPLFNYYAPLPYYFGEIIYLLSGGLIFSSKVMFAISFIGAFLFMYLFARKFWGELGGSLSAIFYSLAHYHALDFYVRGAMGEMWALMFFPAILWASIRLYEKANIFNLTLFAIFLAGLATSHNLSLMIFIPVTIIWLTFLYIKKRNHKFLLYSLLSFLIAFLLSCFYILPVLFEKSMVHVDTTTVGYFSYTEHFKGIKKLFLEREWGYGSSIREVPGGEEDKLSYQIGWVHILGWILAIYVSKLYWQKNRWVSYVIIFSSAIIIFSIFMIHPRSDFIWKLIPFLKYLQFPWRLLIIITLFISFLSGSIFLEKAFLKWRKWLWLSLTILVLGSNFLYFSPEKFVYKTDEEYLSGQNWVKQIMRSNFDFLPIFAKEPAAFPAKDRYEILTGETTIEDFQQGSNWFKFRAETYSHSIIRLSQYYFPNWKVFVDGKETPIDYQSNSLGLMTLILGEGTHAIEARLYDTPIRSIANLLTILGLALTLVIFMISFKKVRLWISYYRRGIN